MRHVPLRRLLVSIAVAAAACASAGAVAAQTTAVEVTPLNRLPFPERGWVVSLPEGAALDRSMVRVRENGRAVRRAEVEPLAASGIRFGVVLALDASLSMEGAPYAAALRAAEAFVGQRGTSAEVGLVAFNGDVTVLRSPTANGDVLLATLRNPPDLAQGTRIHDAVDRSLRLLRRAKISAGTVVVLSDGDDVGSVRNVAEVVAAARREHVRVFAVGLRSSAYDDTTLRALAARTGGAYAVADSAGELEAIYGALGRQLATEYVVSYRSDARPESHVDVTFEFTTLGEAVASYTAPTPTRAAPYERSLLTRFVLSPLSMVAVAAGASALVVAFLLLLGRGRKSVVERIGQFSLPRPQTLLEGNSAAARRARAGARYTRGWWAAFERDLELARIEWSPRRIASVTLAAAAVLILVLATFSPLLALFGLVAPPLAARTVVRWKLRQLRDEFADQLPTALQVLASALRSGYSFTGALGVVVDNTHEPAQSELRRVVQDEQLGVAPEVALRRMGERMANRDVEQVALLAELQRTSGGNAAEIIDTVVETIRERGELRRLVRTLTAQGRMARWILTALPAFLTLFLWFMHPDLMSAFFTSGAGQVALFVSVVLVSAGSLVIQRIIDIDV